MKRVLSTILAIVMVLSVCSSLTFVASAEIATEMTPEIMKVNYEIKTNGLKNGEITFDVYLAPNQTMNSAMLTVKFNNSVFEVVKAGPAIEIDSEGNESPTMSGLLVHGVPKNNDTSYYTFGYTRSEDFKIGSAGKKFVTITLKLKSGKAGSVTGIDFYKGSFETCLAENLIKNYSNFVALETPVVKNYWLEDGAIGFNWNAVVGAAGGYMVYKKVSNEFVNLTPGGIAATSYKDSSNLTNGTTYTYAIASRDGIYGYPSIKHEFSITYVAPPTVTVANTSNGVNVKWTKVSSADKYIIYRSTLQNDAWSAWETIGTSNSTKVTYIDSTVQKGVTYKYAVSAVIDDVETGYKASASIQFVPVITSLATPTVTQKNTAKGIQVNWNKIDGAESYVVYRSVLSGSNWSKWSAIKKGVTTTSYVDTTVKLGTKYKYTVRAVNGSVMSGYQNTKDGAAYNVTPTVKVALAAKGIKVSWSTAANATGYTVYRSQYNTKTKSWTKWASRGTAKANVTSWTDTKVTSGVQYKYTVRACNGSFKSNYNTTGAGTLFLAQPTVKIANASTGVKVSWSKVTGATGYTVYRSEYKNGAWTKWASRGTAKANKTSWVDTKVTSGVQYKYTVRAINGKVASTYVSSNTVLYLAQPKTTVKAVSNGINVAWTQSAGATGYTVYRMEYNTKTKKWSSWKNMGTAKASKTNWTDKSAKKGVTYRYTVKAVNGKTASTYVASGSVKR